jgi:hypothetical protein
MPHTLLIGPLALRLVCADVELSDALAARYSPFLGAAAPQLVLDLALGDLPQRPEALTLAGPRASYTGGRAAGQIDLEAGRSALLVAPEQAVEAVEQLLRVACAMLAFAEGGLLVHGAAIASGPRGYLLLGPSGAGKTTAARNSPGRRVLNDDLGLLWPTARGWRLFATPFSNPSQVAPQGPDAAELAGLFHLVQAPQAALKPMSLARAVAALAARAPLVGADRAKAAELLSRARKMCAIVPSAELQLRPDPSFWELIEPRPS